MLPTKTDFTQTGDLGGEEVKMSFDENSLAFLQGVLTDLYSDKELACVREYSTNALDSHRAAGQTKPIEITTPTTLSPFFRVKDYGVGLSVDDIKKIYSKYGASTSRETNERTGMLGLGSKSALTYTNQFTIVAIKDGIKINVAVSRAEDGGGTMSVLSEVPTSEPNGVEIIIPVNKKNYFEGKAKDFFRFWGPDEVLINGAPPENPSMFKVTDSAYILLKEKALYGHDSCWVVMGNVPYRIAFTKIPDLGYETLQNMRNAVFFVEMGAVNFTPSREQLHYTDRTIETLKLLAGDFEKSLTGAVQTEIDKAETHSDALSLFHEWKGALYRLSISDFSYKGQDLPEWFEVDHDYEYGSGERGRTGTYSPSGDFVPHRKKVSFQQLKTFNVIVGYDKDKLTTSAKNKMRLWSEANGRSPGRYLVCKEMPGLPWTENITPVPWDEVAVMRAPHNTTTKEQPTYDIYEDRIPKYNVVDLDKTKPIYYIGIKDKKDRGVNAINYSDGAQVVVLASNRINALKKRYPTAVSLVDHLRREVEVFYAGVTEEQLKFLTVDWSTRSKCGMLVASQIEDPEVRDLITTVNRQNDEVEKFRREWDKYRELAYKVNRFHLIPEVERYSIYTKYPLLGSLQPSDIDHAHEYINAIYNKFYKGEK